MLFDVARAAVARAARKGVGTRAVGTAVGLARFVNGAFDAQFLHVPVGRDLRVDVVTLDHQRERHAHHEQPNGRYGTEYDD